MPQESSDVNAGGTPSTPQSTETPGTGPVPDNTLSNAGAGGEGGTPGPIPYDRFKEVNDKVKTLTDQVEKMKPYEANYGRMQEHVQKVQAWAKGLQDRPKDATPISPPNDEEENEIREDLFGAPGDPKGDKAWRAMNKFLNFRLKKAIPENGQGVTAEQVQEIVSGAVNAAMGRLSSSIQAPNRFAKWVDNGIIGQEEAQELQGELNNLLNTPQWKEAASNPDNVDYAVERLFTRAVESGKIKPNAPGSRPSPLQPGGPGGAPPPPELPADIDLSSSRFSSLKNVSNDKGKELVSTSMKRHAGAV